MEPHDTVLQMNGISKIFGKLRANDSVDIDVRRGEVLALVGENGAGKTTLMRILFGMYQPDEGEIRLDGEPVSFKNPADSIASGVGMVHQHFMLVPSFTVAENITLGSEPREALYSDTASEKAISESLQRLAITVDPRATTGSLSVALQQKIEIAKVLYRGAKIIVLDEPTAVLTPQETEELFGLLRSLAEGGASIIFISHKLREVFAVADRITVLRAGRSVGTYRTTETSAQEIVSAMTGRSNVNLGRVNRGEHTSETVLAVDGLCTDKPAHDAALRDVSFTVHSGEVVGIAGVEGNGQSVLAEALIGTTSPTAGTIVLGGEAVTACSVNKRRDLGMAFVPEDRHLEGLSVNGTVAESLVPDKLRHRRGVGLLAPTFTSKVRAWVDSQITNYSIKTANAEAKCGSLSGGNQQKIVIARELETEPRCLVLSQPTRGVDLGAIEFIYDRIAEATARGCGVVLISADLDELLRLSDRIVVLYGGEVATTVPGVGTSREEIGLHMTGSGASA